MRAQDYNYDTYRREMVKRDLHFRGGPEAGQLAPDFDLPTVNGGRFRLRECIHQRPVLLEFACITDPVAAGARPVLKNLYDEFGDRIQFVSVYVREAHPGENYPHHTSYKQKMHHARDWVSQEGILWTVAVDSLEGTTHQAYGCTVNPAYLIGRSGHVAFRALCAGQEGLLRDKLRELLRREASGENPITLGQKRNLVIPYVREAAEIDYVLSRAGKKSLEDFHRAVGTTKYMLDKLISKARGILH
jgi:hypothetical protein